VTRNGELETTLAVTATFEILPTNIPEDAILHSHRRENLKSHIINGFHTERVPQAVHPPRLQRRSHTTRERGR
jgi:hypothetical protein